MRDTPMLTGILAGGLGTRLAEETDVKPKPMVEIGGRPILWHIMKRYSAARASTSSWSPWATRARLIKDYFAATTTALNGNLTVDLRTGEVDLHAPASARTGWSTWSTRVPTRRPAAAFCACSECAPDATFMLTYGDGVTTWTCAGCWHSIGRTADWRR